MDKYFFTLLKMWLILYAKNNDWYSIENSLFQV